MAKRSRYAFARRREAGKGKLSAGLAAASIGIFLLSILTDFFLDGRFPYIVGGMCLFAVLLSLYGFFMGLRSFSEENAKHRLGVAGSIGNGVLLVGWAGIYLMGLSFYP